MARLYVEDDQGNVKILPIEQEVVSVGRAADNTIVLPERNVSRHHAKIIAKNGRFLVDDAGSRFGLFVNGERILEATEVRVGDVIGIGDYRLKILEDEVEAEEKQPAPRITSQIRARSSEVEESEPGTSIVSLKEMERVSRRAFGEHAVAVEAKPTTSRVGLVVFVALLVVAALLVVLYIWASRPAELAESDRVQVQATEHLAKSSEEAAQVLSAGGEEDRQESVKVEEEREKQEINIQQAPEIPKGLGFAGSQQVQTRAKTSVRSQARPASAGPSLEGILAQVEAAINQGQLAEAERLLAQCKRGNQCALLFRKLGDRYREQNKEKARALYQKGLSVAADEAMRKILEDRLNRLGSTD